MSRDILNMRNRVQVVLEKKIYSISYFNHSLFCFLSAFFLRKFTNILFISERGLKPVEKITVTEVSKDNFKCDYVAPDQGPYNVNVSFAGKPVPNSPFKVNVAKTGDAGKCRAQGDGLETAIIDMLAEFDVDCSQAGKIVSSNKCLTFPR